MKWKNLAIGKKIAVGFGAVLVLLAAVGILSITGVAGIVGNAGQVIDGNKLDGNLTQKEVDHLNWAGKVNALLTDENVTELAVETDDHKCGFGKWLYGEGRKHAEALMPSLAPLLKEIETPHRHLHESAMAIGKVFKQADSELATLFAMREVDHLKWASVIRDTLLRGDNELNVQTDPQKCALGKWLNTAAAKHAYEIGDTEFKQLWDQLMKEHAALHQSAIEIQKAVQISHEDARKAFESQTMPILGKTLKLLEGLREEAEHELHGMHESKEIFSTQTQPALEKVQKLLKEIRAEAKKHIMTDELMLKTAQGTKRNVTVVSIAAIIIGILMAFFIARGIVAVLKKVSGQMGEGAEQVASAAGQVSSSSQSLAEGASEQAASIEETSSSLEEMSSMTKQNADNASQADSLMNEANRVVGQANDSMGQLTTSMEEISKASEETSKIIKTIDEIAFQTNLLALNAAVEAARAGEAGAGFAVVADEVRNLAMRAADAARNTADLIEGTVIRVKEGGDLVVTTNDAFTDVAKNASKVAELVGEIAAASKEQAEGIEQVNKAVVEMDKVVQQNAANAEESASASEEMNAQAEQMKGVVNELAALVGGRGKRVEHDTASATKTSTTGIHKTGADHAVNFTSRAAEAQQAGEVYPEQVIPMADEDFKDF